MKEVEEDWENNLKNSFKDQLNKCLINELTNLKIQMNDFETSVKNHINSLEKDFENKFYNQIKNININIPSENDDELRKIHIDFHNVKNPSLKNIILSPDFNPLINLILNCFINIRTFILYYLILLKNQK